MQNKQITITALILVLTILLFHWFEIDIWVQDFFYNAGSKHWVLDRDLKIPRLIFYDGIKLVFVISVLVLAAITAVFWKSRFVKIRRQGLVIVLLSCIAVPMAVGGLKAVSNTPCPKDITHYNGRYPHVGFLDSYPENFVQTERQLCFPAAHASGGFALLSLFFLFKTRKNKIMALVAAMSTGWVIGLYKMLIGDHFLSHTIVSMLMAWLIILIISGIIHSRELFVDKP